MTVDPGRDGTLTKDEDLNTVETAFQQADKDGDGTADTKEALNAGGLRLVRRMCLAEFMGLQ